MFLLFYKIIVSFFSFLCQDVNKTRSNCAIIGCNLSKKHKLTQYKTQNGESNYVDHKFFFNFYQELPPVQSLGDRHPNTKELPSWLVHVFCDLKATWHQEAYLGVYWIHHGRRSCLSLYFTFLVKVLPPHFHYKLVSYLYLFLLYILLSQNWKQDQSQYLSCQKKTCIIPSSRNIAIC